MNHSKSRRPPHHRNSGPKRVTYDDQESEEPITDDLAIAAVYAVAEAPAAAETILEAQDDDSVSNCNEDSNEIQLESSSDCSSNSDSSSKSVGPQEQNSGNGNQTVQVKNEEDTPAANQPEPQIVTNRHNDSMKEEKDDSSSSDDDEEDLDLVEELRQMQDALTEEEEDFGRDEAAAPPKTQNEIDAYHANLEEVESIVGKKLWVLEQSRLTQAQQQRLLSSAGKIQHFMVEERIVVVQSEAGLLLEEGNLLIFLRESEPRNSQATSTLIPLGKVFEVFGPVSQPMYSIRLPHPQHYRSEATSKDNGDEPLNSTATNLSPEPTKPTADPWSATGEYTVWLLQHPQRPVFYIHDGDARFIDPQRIYQQSGRGCDASNRHDEEVYNPNELDYSDDEQERQAKKESNNKQTTPDPQPPPSSFHHPMAPQGFHSYGSAGNNWWGRPQQQQPQQQIYPYPPYHHHQQQQQKNWMPINPYQPFASSIPPHTNVQQYAPPEEESDTVYYD